MRPSPARAADPRCGILVACGVHLPAAFGFRNGAADLELRRDLGVLDLGDDLALPHPRPSSNFNDASRPRSSRRRRCHAAPPRIR
jgi:hypothetical protein